MNKINFILILLLFPISVFSQNDDSEKTSSVIIHNNNQELRFIEPLLNQSNDYYDLVSNNVAYDEPGNAATSFFSSLLIPGSGQLANQKWWRAGLFLALEATGIYLAVDYRNKAVNREREYELFADNNWSVVQYSNWLITYNEVNEVDNPYLENLIEVVGNSKATFDTETDWKNVDISILRNVERNTPYLTTDNLVANKFSHTLPDYGSQQYYELIAKYYQYQGGWRDYDTFHDNIGNTGDFYNDRYLIDRNGAYASSNFFEAVRIADNFNSDYRSSRFFASLLIANHFLSAFDTYFTIKLKQNKIEASSSVIPGQQLLVTYNF